MAKPTDIVRKLELHALVQFDERFQIYLISTLIYNRERECIVRSLLGFITLNKQSLNLYPEEYMFEVETESKKPNSPITIRFSKAVYDQLTKLANDKNVSFNNLVVQCCTYAMNHLNTQAESENKDNK